MSAQEDTETSPQASTMIIGPRPDRLLSYMSTLARDERDAERAKFFETGYVEGPPGCPSISVSEDFIARIQEDLSSDDVSAANGDKLTPSGADTYVDLILSAMRSPLLEAEAGVFSPEVEKRIGWTEDATETLQRPFAYSVIPGTNHNIDAAEAITQAKHVTLGLCVTHHPETNPTGLARVKYIDFDDQEATYQPQASDHDTMTVKMSLVLLRRGLRLVALALTESLAVRESDALGKDGLGRDPLDFGLRLEFYLHVEVFAKDLWALIDALKFTPHRRGIPGRWSSLHRLGIPPGR